MKKDVNNNFYVYEWFNKDTNEIFYVGKGRNNRYKSVVDRNQYFINYYNKHNCDVRKVKENMSEEEAFNFEIELIAKYREIGQCQCNLTDGGEGCTFPEGSWNNLFRKLQYLHDVQRAMDDMVNEEDYDVKNLKTKTLQELELLNNRYVRYKENIKANQEYFKSIDLKPTKIDGFELKIQNEELNMLTKFIAENIATKQKEFKKFLTWKHESDFICTNFNSDKFLGLILEDLNYSRRLIETIFNVLNFMKRINENPNVHVPVKIRSFTIKDRFIQIKFDTREDKTLHRVKIDLYDVIWGILMFKNEPLFQILYREIVAAPFIE